MRTIGGNAVIGAGMIALAVSLATGCAEPEEVDPVLADVAEGVGPEGKPGAGAGPSSASTTMTMTCTQETAGCVPTGYRIAKCKLSNLKPSSYVVACVKAECPAVYDVTQPKGQSCDSPQQVAADGTAYAFFPLLPDATYDFTAYSGSKNGGASSTVLGSTSAPMLSSIGEATQCGGQGTNNCW